MNKHFQISVIRTGKDHFATIFFDVTEIKTTQQALQKSEENLRITLKSIGDAVIATDTLGRITLMNPIAEKLTGWKINEAIGKDIKEVFNIINANTRLEAVNPIFKVIKEGEIIGLANHTVLISKNGEEYQIADSGAPIKDEKNEILGAVLVFRDVSEEYKIQKQLAIQEEQFRKLFENAPFSISIFSISTKNIIAVNNKFIEYTGYSKDEIIGKEIFSISPNEIHDEILNWIASILKDRSVANNYGIAFTKDGREISTLQSAEIINFNGEESIMTMAIDISEQKKLEEQLRQSQKMDAIGQLAGGIAHDFNNMLAAILNSAELIQLQSYDAEKQKKYLKLIVDATLRASDLTKKLLAFARKEVYEIAPISIHQTILSTIAILSRSIDKKIAIETNFRAVEHTILGDSTQIMNIFINMGINAAHAMPNGGKITFTTRNVYLDEVFCKSSQFDLVKGYYILIDVNDTGTGISSENISKIFDPFFTTKAQGKGTGLGLSMVYGSIAQHRGAIHVYSELERGTLFHIYLPITNQNEIELDSDEVGIIKGEGTILVVDDEEFIRTTTVDMLKNIGYNALPADSAKEALAIYEENQDKISLIILDMIMPEMNGKECFKELRKINPNVKVILASGFSKDEDIDEMKNLGLASFVRKPFHTAALSRLILEVMKQ